MESIKKALQEILFFRKITIFLFLLLAISPIIADIILNNKGFIYSLAMLVSGLSLLIFCFSILNTLFSFRVSAYILGIFVNISVPVELVHLFIFKDYITRQGIIAIFQTNINEGLAFLRGYEWFAILWLGLFVFFMISFIKLPVQKFPLNFKNILVLSSLLIFFAVFKLIQIKVSIDSSGKNISYFVKKEIVKKYPFNILYRSYEIQVNNKSIKKHLKYVHNFTFNGNSTSDFDEVQIYVLIIGESARASNYQLLGYEKETTPNLMKMQNIIVFPDFYANANVTNAAIPLLVTRATPEDYNLSYKEKSIVSLFKEAGFTTYWICNQEIFKGYYAQNYKQEIDNFYYKSGADNDEIVLEVLDEILSDKETNKKFIVINLFGNHYGINSTPEKFRLFTPNLDDRKLVSRSLKYREFFINSYDNSVLFQDFILSEIINQINVLNSVSYVYFTSDHGESLFDEPDFFYGHGAEKLTKEQVHIPAFIWYSRLFEHYNDKMINNLKMNSNKRLSNDNTFYTLAQLASIGFDMHNGNLSIADSSFKENEQRSALINYTVKISEFD